MKNFIKQRHIPHWGLVVFMVLLNCVASIAQEEPTLDPELTIVSQPDTISIASKDGVVNLSFVVTMGEREISYQWYQSPDKTTENGVEIEGATESSYTTEPFSTKEIRYYYCVASADEESVTSKVAAVAYTGLPILYVNTPNGVDITSKVVWTEETKLTLSDAEDASWNFENITTSIRGRGNTTWTQKKKPYALKLDKKQEIMGMPKHKRWVLIANYLDNSFLKNHMAFYLSEKLEMDYTVHGKFVNLIFNGVYRGLYWLGEAIKVDENRVNINDGSKKIKDDEDKDYLIEMDKYFDEPVKFKSSIRQMPYMIKNDDYMVDDDENMTSGGSARLERLQAKIDKLEKMLYPDFVEGMSTNNCSSPNEIYTKIIDVDSWAKFWLVNEMMDNNELAWPKSAYFTFESKTNIFKAGPVWDFDWASLNKKSSTGLRNYIYYNALFKSPLFKEAAKRVWNEHSSSIDVETEIETMRDYLRTAANVDKIRWGVHLDPSKVERVDFDAYVDFLKDVLTTKIAVVDKYVTQSLPQITIVSPTIALSNESFEYNGTENKPVVTITDDEHSLTEGTDYTISYYDNVNAGTATVVFAAKGNYAGLQEKTFTISPKPVTLNVASDSKTYGENDPAFDYSVEGLVSINNVTEVLTGVVLTRESGENTGEYAITATVDAAANPNYDVAINNGVLTINPDDTEITVAISGLSGTVTYDGSEKTVHGFSMTSNNDAYSLDLISYTGDSTALGTNAGSYPMGLSAKDFQNTSTNFTNVVFEVTDGNLVVQPKSVSLTVADVSKIYGEDDPTLDYSVEGLVSINDVTDELSGVVLTRESGEDAGEYAITATVDAAANPNYVISKNNGIFTITPKTTTYAAVKILEDQNGKRIELDGAYTGEGLISIPDPIEVNSVDFKRNLQAGIPSTVMLPISLPEGTTVNAKYYQIQNVGPNGKGGWKATFTYIGDGNLPQANTPYAFILNEGENKLEFNLNGGVATVQTDEINNVDDESGNWYFKGTYAHKEWNQDDDELGRAYAFAGSNNEGGASKGQFGKIVDGAWANPMRAYLCKKDASLKPSAVLARSFAPGVSAVASYSSMALPESIDIEFVDKIDNDEKVLATGFLNTRTGEFQILRKYDLKGRLLNGSPRARGAYYGKKTFKK